MTGVMTMCRNIKMLFHFQPPATDEEIRAASIQFVRKISGFTKPSKSNEAAFDLAIEEISRSAKTLLDGLVTTGAPRDRAVEAEKARERGRVRFGAQRQRRSAGSDTGSTEPVTAA